MRALLDTHVMLWAAAASQRLAPDARATLEDLGTTLLWSPVSTAELAIKSSIGKLHLPKPLPDFLERHIEQLGLTPLPLTDAHALALESLPIHHRDPFDRLLIAQAIVEAIPLISADPALGNYGVRVIW